MPRVWCATLGCDKNLVDSEALLGRFVGRGVESVSDPQDADIWILNTCGFIEAARRDSLEAVEELVATKGGRTLVVCGCWSQEHGDTIREMFPGVDVVAGVGRFDEVVAACLDAGAEAASPGDTSAFPLAGPLVGDPMTAPYTGIVERPLLTPAHVAFVKIGEGCNFSCSFCRIPLIRGRQRSRPVSEIRAEVASLVERGVAEVQLVSQNTSDYGRDSGEALGDLVRALDGVDGLRRIRLFYLYSGVVAADDLLRLLDVPKVVPYLDLPVQHASPRLLKAMRRPGAERSSPDFFARLRRERPELVLRSTALLGFPGEEDEDVSLLADFLAEVEFDHLGTYRYSPEPGTASFALPDRVPDEVILDREALIQDLQEEIALRRMQRRLGQRHEVLIDRIIPADMILDEGLDTVLAELAGDGDVLPGPEVDFAGDASALAVGRSYHFGYDVDGVVLLPGAGLEPGAFVDVEFAAVPATDVWGLPVPTTNQRNSPGGTAEKGRRKP